MVGIALVAIVCALPAAIAATGGLDLLVIISATLGAAVMSAAGLGVAILLICAAVSVAPPGYRREASAWLACLYPVLTFGFMRATGFVPWNLVNSQLRPKGFFLDLRFFLDFELFVATLVVVFTMILPIATLVLCGPLMLSAVSDGIRRKRIRVVGAVGRLAVPLCAWTGLYALAL
jgi:hypothetical protein